MPISPISTALPQNLRISPEIKNLKFLANVSHEIRNPVNAIFGLTQLLKDTASNEEREELVNGLLKTSESLLELLNNLLDYTKLESGELEFTYTSTDLRKSLQESLCGFKTIAETKGIKLHITVEDSFPQLVLIDRIKVTQVIINLVSNALKFTSSGFIEVELGVVEKNGAGCMLKCSVKDTGIGIPKNRLKAIFEAFEQGSGEINLNYGGTGLGLNICKSLVHKMRGEIQVKSKLGIGSEFQFFLPLEIQ